MEVRGRERRPQQEGRAEGREAVVLHAGLGPGEDEYIETTTYEFSDSDKAALEIADFVKAPSSVPLKVTAVPGLGDDAYTLGDSPYGRKGAGTLVVRRANVMIRLDSSSLQAAKRFARRMVNALDAK